MDTIKMVCPKELDRDLCRNALSYLMFLKRKRTGKVKACGCADGRPMREYISKEETSSPTVSTYALFCHCIIAAIERCTVYTCDICGAFLQSPWPEDKLTYLRFTRLMVDMICKIDPKYKKYVVKTFSGRKILYGKLTRGVYGTTIGAALWFDKLTGHLHDWGYRSNPYDACTWNQVIDGKQYTLQFYVDDIIILHANRKVILKEIEKFRIQFKTKT